MPNLFDMAQTKTLIHLGLGAVTKGAISRYILCALDIRQKMTKLKAWENSIVLSILEDL